MKRPFPHLPFSPARFPFFYGWPVLAFGALGVLMSAPGQTIGVSVFTDPLLNALSLSRDQLSLAYMFGTLASACLLPFAGKLYDRVGSRTATVVASVALGTVLVVLSQADRLAAGLAGWLGLTASAAGFAVILPGFFALRFWGQGILILSSSSMVAKWFNRKRGLASGISGICVALGFSTAPLIFDRLIGTWGWSGAWQVLAAVVGGGFALVALVTYRDNPEQCGLLPDGERASDEALARANANEPFWTRGEALRTWVFWTFSLSLALFGLYTTGLTFHVVSVFAEAGMAREHAVGIFVPVSIVAVAVHLGGGWLSDPMPLNRLLVAMLAAMSLSTLGLVFFGPGLPLAMVILGNGMAGGLTSLLAAVAWATFFGRRHLGAIGGVHMSVSVLCSAIGPVLFSQSLARSGSYRPAALACLASGLLLMQAALRAGHLADNRRKAVEAVAAGDGCEEYAQS